MPEIVGRLRTPRLPSAPATPIVGEMYYNTATNLLYWWNGTAWVSASGGGGGVDWEDTGVGVGISYATTLPASPVNGQEAILVDSITNPLYQWRFRYNAGSSSTYKWEFIGGAPCLIAPIAYQPAGTAAYYTDSAAASSLGVPRAGEYIVNSGANITASAASAQYLGFDFDPNTRIGMPSPAVGEASLYLEVKATCTASQVIRNVFYCGTAVSTYNHRSLSALPIRVS